MDNNKKITHPTLKAAKKFNRRTAIKRGAAVAAFAGVAPMFVKNAFAASSGEVNVVMWGEYLPDSVVADFKAKTGITVNHTKIGDNGEIISNGGRVLNITSTGTIFKSIRSNIFRIIKKINWKNGFFRKDIGWKVIKK